MALQNTTENDPMESTSKDRPKTTMQRKLTNIFRKTSKQTTKPRCLNSMYIPSKPFSTHSYENTPAKSKGQIKQPPGMSPQTPELPVRRYRTTPSFVVEKIPDGPLDYNSYTAPEMTIQPHEETKEPSTGFPKEVNNLPTKNIHKIFPNKPTVVFTKEINDLPTKNIHQIFQNKPPVIVTKEMNDAQNKKIPKLVPKEVNDLPNQNIPNPEQSPQQNSRMNDSNDLANVSVKKMMPSLGADLLTAFSRLNLNK